MILGQKIIVQMAVAAFDKIWVKADQCIYFIPGRVDPY